MELQIYTGCMGSGKSAALINVFTNLDIDQCDFYTFGNQPFIHSRNGQKIKAIPIKDLDNLGSRECVLIDECQFHCWDFEEWKKILNKYKYIFLAGLEIMQEEEYPRIFYTTNFYHSVFYYKLPLQITINKFVGKCDVTGEKNATHSLRFSDAKDVRDRDNYVSLSENEAEQCRQFTKEEYLEYKKRYNNSKTNE